MSENNRRSIFERRAERYDQSIWTDKGVFGSYDTVLAEVVRVVQVKAGLRVPELGIGTGNLTQQFVALGCEIWGVDFSAPSSGVTRMYRFWQSTLAANGCT